MSEVAPTSPARRRRFHFQEGGLVVVIIVLGMLLTVFGGRVKVPQFETNAQGESVRAFRVNAAGEREPVVVERNKFLNAPRTPASPPSWPWA
jgi:hypothetical protein